MNGDNSLSYADDQQIVDRLLAQEPQRPTRTNAPKSGSADPSSDGFSTLSTPGLWIDAPGPAFEGIPFELTGTIQPPGSYNGYVTWGHTSWPLHTDLSGNFSTWLLIGDDGAIPGNGTASDVVPIDMVVWDVNASPTESASASVNLTVNNVAPVLDVEMMNNPRFSSTWGITGTVIDDGLYDAQTITIDWGDGSPVTVLEGILPGEEFSTSHLYPWIDDSYPVQITVADDDAGSGSASLAAANDLLKAQGILVEEYWGDAPETWHPGSDPLWAHDNHKRATTVSPGAAVPDIHTIEWFAEPWVGQSVPLTSGMWFTTATRCCSQRSVGLTSTAFLQRTPTTTCVACICCRATRSWAWKCPMKRLRNPGFTTAWRSTW